jgi:hypothetical protein
MFKEKTLNVAAGATVEEENIISGSDKEGKKKKAKLHFK